MDKDRQYNIQLKKFKQFKLEKNEDGIWAIKCKHGQVQPNDYEEKRYLYVGIYGHRGGLNLITAKFPEFIQTQDGQGQGVYKFPAEYLGNAEFIDMLEIKRKGNGPSNPFWLQKYRYQSTGNIA